VSYIDDHHRRWGALFANEPWWEMHCALYEGDWEGADIALDQMVYELAKARGVDTTRRARASPDPHPSSADRRDHRRARAALAQEHASDHRQPRVDLAGAPACSSIDLQLN